MTRRNALKTAIFIVQKAEMKKQEKEKLLSVLNDIADELPCVHWTEKAIFDACEEFLLSHPYITLKDFERADMPSHPTIKNRFGMTAKEFRDKYYPIGNVTTRSPYFERSVEEWNELFRTEFEHLRCTGQDDYNRRRDKSLPTWNTMAKMNGLKRWNELLEKVGIKKESAVKGKREMEVHLIQATKPE